MLLLLYGQILTEYKKLEWGRNNYVEKNRSFMFNKTLLTSEQQIFKPFSSQNKAVKVIKANRFPEKRPPTSRQIFRDF